VNPIVGMERGWMDHSVVQHCSTLDMGAAVSAWLTWRRPEAKTLHLMEPS
jgi:hypothetical protein